MAALSAVQILAKYFNEGDGKRSIGEFQKELKALSPEEKTELATLAAPLLGVELKS